MTLYTEPTLSTHIERHYMCSNSPKQPKYIEVTYLQPEWDQKARGDWTMG